MKKMYETSLFTINAYPQMISLSPGDGENHLRDLMRILINHADARQYISAEKYFCIARHRSGYITRFRRNAADR
jgi:hypothetical protein